MPAHQLTNKSTRARVEQALAAAANPLLFRAKEGTRTAPCQVVEGEPGFDTRHARPCWIPLPTADQRELRQANVQQAALPILTKAPTETILMSVIMVSCNKVSEGNGSRVTLNAKRRWHP